MQSEVKGVFLLYFRLVFFCQFIIIFLSKSTKFELRFLFVCLFADDNSNNPSQQLLHLFPLIYFLFIGTNLFTPMWQKKAKKNFQLLKLFSLSDSAGHELFITAAHQARCHDLSYLFI